MVSRRVLKSSLLYGAVILLTCGVLFHNYTDGTMYEKYHRVKSHAKNQYEQLIFTVNSTLANTGNKFDVGGPKSSDSFDTGLYPVEQKSEAVIHDLLQRLDTPIYSNGTDSKKVFKENKDFYSKILSQNIDEPKVDNLVRPGDPDAGTARATVLSLVRNEDLEEILASIKQFEHMFNRKFMYPYTFLNDGEFSENFKETIKRVLPRGRKVQFGRIEPDEWNMPSFIDQNKYISKMEVLEEKGVGHSVQESYHNMCRFYSKNFYHHPLLKEYRYTWRLEPSVNFYCEMNYDVFKFMEMNEKVYGYTLNVYDNPLSVETLWPNTMEFIRENPQYLHENGAFEWLKENGQKPDNFQTAGGYSTCHFWTNFEITDMEFLRSEAYEKYVQFLDEKGGFYYERWGDAPVRSIALALFTDKSKIHWFRDIGYNHFPYTNCPTCSSDRCNDDCNPGRFSPWTSLDPENCQATWIKYEMTEKDLGIYH